MRTTRTYSPAGITSSPYEGARATRVDFVDASMQVFLKDGRVLSVPLHWYPRLERATDTQRRNHTWIGRGIGIHWPDIDEDIAIESLLIGRKAFRSNAYMTGVWPADLERERKRIEDSYATKKAIPGKRVKPPGPRAKRAMKAGR